jgi:pimeloyl-ACP methyl ester carboxylesterase
VSSQTPQDQFVRVGEINTRFWAVGETGSNVLLLHGIADSADTWTPTIGALAESHRVLAFDQIGHGLSDKPPVVYSPSYIGQFVADFMDTQGVAGANVVGHSMGGAVALQFALQFPGRVQKLVLVSSAGLGRELTHLLRLPTLPLIGEWLTRPNRKGTAQFLRACVVDPALVTEDLVEFAYERAALPGAQASFLSILRYGCSLRGVRRHIIRPLVDELPTIAAPTLVVWGQQDRILPVEHAYVAQAGIPNARLHIFDPCGHIPQMERTEEFNALLLDFLSD